MGKTTSTKTTGAARPDPVFLNAMEILPRLDPGVDWGGKRRVLARSADGRKSLFVREGHYAASCGVRGFGREYRPMAVVLYSRDGWRGTMGAYWDEVAGGRLDMTALRRDHGALIDEVFDRPGLAALLDPRRTLVVPAEDVEA